MAQKTNKYAYNRNYYSNLNRGNAFNGNAARQLAVVPDEYEEDEELMFEAEPEYEAPERDERRRGRAARPERRPEYGQQKAPETKVRYRVKVGLLPVMVFAVAIAALLSSAFGYLEVQSKINQADKQIRIAQTKLADVEALNASLSSALDTEIDRNYIYTVAVARLGMVYPDKNQVVYYEPAEEGYVRQLSAIPMK
ncbi:MAG: hypothetical protein IK001_08030 [Lachnospiraceae bacterium]|nr:hypothetical protein [Lachnospiraceae bacterium]